MKPSNSIQSPLPRVACACALILMAGGISPRAQEHGHLAPAVRSPVAQTNGNALAPQKLPPLPAGVSKLRFSDFFVQPVGAYGLKLTDTLRQLDGKKVQILGYMVKQETQSPGVFILSPYPAQIHDHDNALADDLPPTVVHVSVPTSRDQPVPHSPRPLLLTGTLSVGNRTEADGRISIVRLALDPPEAGEGIR